MSTDRPQADWNQYGNKGVACPKCGCRDSRVADIRHGKTRSNRVKVCRACGKRFNTTEQLAAVQPEEKPKPKRKRQTKKKAPQQRTTDEKSTG